MLLTLSAWLEAMAKPLRVLFVGYGQHGTTFLKPPYHGSTRKRYSPDNRNASKRDLRCILSLKPKWLWTPRLHSHLWADMIITLLLLVANPRCVNQYGFEADKSS